MQNAVEPPAPHASSCPPFSTRSACHDSRNLTTDARIIPGNVVLLVLLGSLQKGESHPSFFCVCSVVY